MNKLLYGLVCLLHINWCLHEVSKCFHRDTKRETCPPFSLLHIQLLLVCQDTTFIAQQHTYRDPPTHLMNIQQLSNVQPFHPMFICTPFLLHPGNSMISTDFCRIHTKKRVFKVSAVNNISILSFASCVALGVAMMATPSVSLMLWSRQKYLNPWLDRH